MVVETVLFFFVARAREKCSLNHSTGFASYTEPLCIDYIKQASLYNPRRWNHNIIFHEYFVSIGSLERENWRQEQRNRGQSKSLQQQPFLTAPITHKLAINLSIVGDLHAPRSPVWVLPKSMQSQLHVMLASAINIGEKLSVSQSKLAQPLNLQHRCWVAIADDSRSH